MRAAPTFARARRVRARRANVRARAPRHRKCVCARVSARGLALEWKLFFPCMQFAWPLFARAACTAAAGGHSPRQTRGGPAGARSGAPSGGPCACSTQTRAIRVRCARRFQTGKLYIAHWSKDCILGRTAAQNNPWYHINTNTLLTGKLRVIPTDYSADLLVPRGDHEDPNDQPELPLHAG